MTANPQHHIYRVTYEAFAQFSSALTQTRNLEQVVQCLERRVKYLFDYSALRISFRYQKNWIHITVGQGRKAAEISKGAILFEHEEDLRRNGIPRVWKLNENPQIAEALKLEAYCDKQLWGWHFKNSELKDITISLITSHQNNFSTKSIPFIRLFIEILESKLTEIALFDELAAKNASIEASLGTIAEKNSEIQAIMEHQDEVIKKQTADLQARNDKLVEISVLNAHSVREPLSRILGLTNLMGEFKPDELSTTILPMIKQSSEELDNALKEVINMALTDIPKFKV